MAITSPTNNLAKQVQLPIEISREIETARRTIEKAFASSENAINSLSYLSTKHADAIEALDTTTETYSLVIGLLQEASEIVEGIGAILNDINSSV